MPIDFPSNPTNGQVYGTYVYDSSITAWRNLNTDAGATQLATSVGLRNIVPTSIAKGASGSATVNSNGTVSFTATESVSLNGVFSSAYDNYRILLTTTSATASNPVGFRVRSSGSDNSSSYQWYIVVINNTTTARVGTSGAAYAEIGYTGTDGTSAAAVDVRSPFLAARTFGAIDRQYSNEVAVGGFWHNSNLSYDGFTLYLVNAGTMTGTIQVFGYNK